MLLQDQREQVVEYGKKLVTTGLTDGTFGNLSVFDRESGLMAISPSGMDYFATTPEDVVVADLEGKVVEGKRKPSSELDLHRLFYRRRKDVNGVVHTHSTYATAWAQAGKDIPNIGTTHADYFHEAIPCTEDMTKEEVEGNYELETGNVIVKRFIGINPDHTPGVLVKNHGPFSWGTSPANAVYNAKVMEQCAHMAFVSFMVNPDTTMNPLLIEKHYNRKHGPNAYYGQKKK